MVTVYECAYMSSLVYKFGYESDRHQADAHLGIRSDAEVAMLGGWSIQQWIADTATGFVATIFSHAQELILACRGSASTRKDWLGSDVRIALGIAPKNKIQRALELFYLAKRTHVAAHVTVVGHSLGGGIAQAVAGVTGCDAVTFNAPGMKSILNRADFALQNAGRIVNFRAELDPVSELTGEPLGVTYDLSTYPQYRMRLLDRMKQKGDSHRMITLLDFIDKQSWRDDSPFNNQNGKWTAGRGAVALPR